jgi:hypothetical protein
VVAVTNAATGAMVCAVGSSGSNIALAEGDFVIDVGLQMNVPRGIYLVQVGVWNRQTDQAVGKGPSLVVQIGEGVRFAGPVQLNAQMTIASAAPQLVSTQ